MKNKKKLIIIIVTLVFCISIGFAVIKSSYSIIGNVGVTGKLRIYFDNLLVKAGSITAETPATIVDENQLEIQFGVVLSKPEDFYEFEVELVNASNVAAYIKNFIVAPIDENIKKYIVYDIKYMNGVSVSQGDVILGNSRKKLSVRISFKEDEDITAIIGPNEIAKGLTLPLDFTMHFAYKAPTNIYEHILAKTEWISDSTLDYNDKNIIGNYVLSGTESNTNPIYFYHGNVTDNNVVFAGQCWKMVRTTESGGIKLLYNGKQDTNGQCINSSASIETNKFNNNSNSLSYVGYMFDSSKVYNFNSKSVGVGVKRFAKSVTASSGDYSLNDTKNMILWATGYNDANDYHYTCFKMTGGCKPVSYVFRGNSSHAYYVELNGEANVEQLLSSMIGYNSTSNINVANSTIKNQVDSWYESNLTSFTSKIIDEYYCNDRSVKNLAGWNSSNGSITDSHLTFGQRDDLSCPNQNDKFTVGSSGNGKLRYPIGLLTKAEARMMGNSTVTNYWTMTPSRIDESNVYNYFVDDNGDIKDDNNVTSTHGIRPVITISKNSYFYLGKGTADDPYIIIDEEV